MIACDRCKKMVDDPVNPCKKVLVCSSCYDRIIENRGQGKSSFTISDMEEMFSFTKQQQTLMDFVKK